MSDARKEKPKHDDDPTLAEVVTRHLPAHLNAQVVITAVTHDPINLTSTYHCSPRYVHDRNQRDWSVVRLDGLVPFSDKRKIDMRTHTYVIHSIDYDYTVVDAVWRKFGLADWYIMAADMAAGLLRQWNLPRTLLDFGQDDDLEADRE